MELSSGVIIIVALVVVVSLVLFRWGRRHEAPPPMDAPHTPVRSSTMARESGESPTLVQWLLERAFEQTGVRVADDDLARKRIEQAAAKALEDLRNGDSATISLPFLVADEQGPRHFSVRFKRKPGASFELER